MTRALDRANIQVGDAPLSNRNHLINGAFAVAQRGTSFTSSDSANNDDTYVLDRWYILSDGNDIIDVSQETSTIPTNGKYAIALDVETANKKFGIAQIIEGKNCVGLIGDTITFSFKAKVSDTSKLDNVKAAIVSWSGTEDSVTSDIISAWGNEGTNPTLITNATYENTPANLSLTTSYATYSVSANIDTSGANNIIVFIWSDVTDTTAGHFLYVTDCQLERGNTATPFEHRSYGDELVRCQRYYEIGNFYVYITTSSPGSYNPDGIFQGEFKVQKRAAPTMTKTNYTNVGYATSASPENITVHRFRQRVELSGSGYGGHEYDWQADSEL